MDPIANAVGWNWEEYFWHVTILAHWCYVQPGGETLSYGVTFQVYGHERELQELDRTLDMYGNFSTPTVVHGDRQKDQQYNGMGGGRSGKMGGMIVPQDVLSSDGKQVPLIAPACKSID